MLNSASFPPHHTLVDLSPCIEQSPSCVLHLQASSPGRPLWRRCACILHLNFELVNDLTLDCTTPREFGQAEIRVTNRGGSTTGGLCCFSLSTRAILLQNWEQDTLSRAKAAKISLPFLFVIQAISKRRYIKRRLKQRLMTRWGKKQGWYQRPQ